MNNYKKLSIVLLLSISLFWACDNEKQLETSEGISYVLVDTKEGENLVEGEFAIFSLKLVDSEDSIY